MPRRLTPINEDIPINEIGELDLIGGVSFKLVDDRYEWTRNDLTQGLTDAIEQIKQGRCKGTVIGHETNIAADWEIDFL